MRGTTTGMSLLVATVCLAGCGGSSTTGTSGTSASGAGPVASAAPAAKDAGQIVATLAAKDSHLKATITYTAATDPNHLLGRPNGYASKASFSDDQLSAGDLAGTQVGDVNQGGSIEMYATNSGASKRAAYIQSIVGSVTALDEYDYVAGPALLRIAQNLTPDQATALSTEFGAVIGASPKLVTASS